MKDKYDEAIDYLTANPTLVGEAWNDPRRSPGGCLFIYAERGESNHCGCLTQVRKGILPAQTPKLTAEIRADERIPCYPADITIEMLPVFAEWQRRLDRELGGE